MKNKNLLMSTTGGTTYDYSIEYLGTREGIKGYRYEKFSDLVGEILSLIEVAGLNESQEYALKSKIKGLIWDMWDKPQFSWTEAELAEK